MWLDLALLYCQSGHAEFRSAGVCVVYTDGNPLPVVGRAAKNEVGKRRVVVLHPVLLSFV